jgi:hypothetical protein
MLSYSWKKCSKGVFYRLSLEILWTKVLTLVSAHSVCSRISALRYRLCREIRLYIYLTSELLEVVTVNMLYWSVCKENEEIVQNSTFVNIRTISWRSGIHWRYHSLSGRMNSNLTIAVMDIIHRPAFYLKTRWFGDFILSPSSGRTYSDGPNR